GTATRAEVRSRRLPHRCTYLLVFNRRGDLFIHLRTPDKDMFPSYWDVTAGGVLASGEAFFDGAGRELAEELGVKAEPEPMFPLRYQDDRCDVHGWVYRVFHDGPFTLQPEEIVTGEFVPLRDLPARIERDPFCPDGLKALAEYRRISGK
ncbi:MAG: NUDIX hydrolase, partial [Planctomycetia bacterium]